MRNIKKAVVLLLSVLVILALTNITFASTIQPRNTSDGNSTSEEANTTDNETGNTTNNTSNTTNNTSGLSSNSTSNYASNRSAINTTNSAEDIPHTGIEDNLNLALFLLLAVVLGMFSLVQYRRIVKKDE